MSQIRVFVITTCIDSIVHRLLVRPSYEYIILQLIITVVGANSRITNLKNLLYGIHDTLESGIRTKSSTRNYNTIR